MKKIYALVAAAFVAMAANAQDGAPLYITGQSAAAEDGGFAKMWDVTAEGATPMKYADGVYSVHVNGLSSFTISTVANGSWDDWKAAAFTCKYGDVPGKAVELVSGGDNILCPWLGEYDVVVSGDLKTITLTTNTPQPPLEVFLRGDMNNWLNDGATDTEEGKKWMFSTTDNKIFKLVLGEGMAIMPGETFKIADAGWAKFNYGSDGETLAYDVEIPVFFNATENLSFAEADGEFTGVCYFQNADEANGIEPMVYFSNDKDAECPFENQGGVAGVVVDSNSAAQYFNLQGVRVANPENGIFIVVKDGKATKIVK